MEQTKQNWITKISSRIIKPNVLNFQTLGIVTRDAYYSLRDDGFVDDILKHAEKVYLEFGICQEVRDTLAKKLNDRAKKSSDCKDYVIGGGCINFLRPESGNWIIFTIESGNRGLDIRNKSHEETHVLQGIEKLGLLEKKIKRQAPNFNFKLAAGLDPAPADEKDMKEYIAAIGSCYALTRFGIPISSVESHIANRFETKALEDYQKLLRGENVKLGAI